MKCIVSDHSWSCPMNQEQAPTLPMFQCCSRLLLVDHDSCMFMVYEARAAAFCSLQADPFRAVCLFEN